MSAQTEESGGETTFDGRYLGVIVVGGIGCLLGAVLPWLTPPSGVWFVGPNADMTGLDMMELANPLFSGGMTALLGGVASVMAVVAVWDSRMRRVVTATGLVIVLLTMSYVVAPSIAFTGGTASPLLAKSGGPGAGLGITFAGGCAIAAGNRIG